MQCFYSRNMLFIRAINVFLRKYTVIVTFGGFCTLRKHSAASGKQKGNSCLALHLPLSKPA